MTDPHRGAPWWQRGVIYQVYPRSFRDTDGDGVGDLPGIIERLDHLAWLGVDAIWISPIFRSPMADFGYDVADYRDVDPLFGTLADLDRLIDEAHRRGHARRPRLRPQPHLRPAPLVRRVPVIAHEPAARLVPLVRRRGRRRAAEPLDVDVRRAGLDRRCADGAVVLPRLPPAAARPELAQPRGRRRDARRPALLVRARRSTGSASTSSGCCSRTRPCATTPPTGGARGRTCRGSSTSSPACGPSPTSTRIAC